MHFFHLLFCQIYVEIYFCLPYLHLVYLYINIFFTFFVNTNESSELKRL